MFISHILCKSKLGILFCSEQNGHLRFQAPTLNLLVIPPPPSIFIPVCWRLSLCLCANGLDNLQIALLKPFFLFSLWFLCSRRLVWLGQAHVALFLDSAVCIISPRHLCPAVKLHCMCAPIHFAKESLQRGEERRSGHQRCLCLSFFKVKLSQVIKHFLLQTFWLEYLPVNIFDLGPEMNLKEISWCCAGVHSGWTHMKEEAASRVQTVIESYWLWWANCKEARS